MQGRNVAAAAADAGVSHLVYGSAGPGTPGTGVAPWDVKLEVAAYARSRGLPLTVLRPMAFMELLTDKDLYPPVAAWHLMPRLVGGDRPLPWLSAEDLGAIAARAFGDPTTFVGADISLAAEVCTLSQCRDIWRRVTGRNPRRFPMPVWLFERFVGPDLTRMWRWLATHDIDADVTGTRAIHSCRRHRRGVRSAPDLDTARSRTRTVRIAASDRSVCSRRPPDPASPSRFRRVPNASSRGRYGAASLRWCTP